MGATVHSGPFFCARRAQAVTPNLVLAVALLRRQARVSITHHETGVPRPKLRALHWELHGRGASCGQLPAIGGATIQTRAQQVHAGLFAALYGRYAGPGLHRQLAIRAVIAAYDLYRLMALPQAQLDFNGAWVIARDLRVGTSEWRHCAPCELHYLLSSASRLAPTCPFCALYARRGGRTKQRMVLPRTLDGPSSDPVDGPPAPAGCHTDPR